MVDLGFLKEGFWKLVLLNKASDDISLENVEILEALRLDFRLFLVTNSML